MANVKRSERKIKFYNKLALATFALCVFLFLVAIWTGVGEFAGTGAVLLLVPIVAKVTALNLGGFFEDF